MYEEMAVIRGVEKAAYDLLMSRGRSGHDAPRVRS